MILYGIAGTNGSGKDSMGEYLAHAHKFLFVSVTEMLRIEARKRGLPVEREVLRTISAEWRRAGGLGVLVDKAIEVYEETGGDKQFTGLVMASIRNPGEVDRIHELGGKMVWLDADPKIRYRRISGGREGREEEDGKSFEEFMAEQAAEMQPSGDAATLNLSVVKVHCDISIDNSSDSVKEFEVELEKKLGLSI